MASKFFQVAVKDIKQTTQSCTVITFDIKKEWEEAFAFKQGQHLTLMTNIDGESIRRSYSLCSSPIDNAWKVAVKKLEGGKFSTYVNEQLKIGDVLEVMPPNGRFFVNVAPEKQRDFVAFAAGSGITPILSIIRTHLYQEPQSRFRLFYVNQTVASIILKEEIEALKNTFLDRFEVAHFLTREARDIPLFNGRITAKKLDTIFDKLLDIEAIDHYFICGPMDMIFLIRDYLTDHGVNPRQVHFELFNTGSERKAESKRKSQPVVNGKMAEIQVLEGGKKISFSIPQGTETILEAALKKAADLPFACKGGVCCTCRAKLLEGKVEMKVNYALEQEELDAGYILACQSVPVSDKVVVDFDG